MILLASIGIVLISSLAVMNSLPGNLVASDGPAAPDPNAQPPASKKQPEPQINPPRAEVPRVEPPAGGVISPINNPGKPSLNSSKFMEGEVLVGLKSGINMNSPEVTDLIERNGGKIAQYYSQIKVVLVQVEAGKEREFIQKISMSALVEYAELNPIANPAPVPPEPRDRPPAGGAIAPILNPVQPPANASDPIKGEVLVGFKSGVDVRSTEVANLIERNGGKIARYIDSIRVILVLVDPGKEQEFMGNISRSELVAYAELNRVANPAP